MQKDMKKIAVTTVLLPPSPERKGLTWREFLARHKDVLLCADMFTKEIWTFCGLRRAFVLVVMLLKSRTILLAEATFSPHAGWMAQRSSPRRGAKSIGRGT